MLQETSPVKILVADDDSVTRLLLKSHLIRWGHEVVECSDGAEAWEILQKEDSPRLAILDWVMPKKDGLEICRELRSSGTDHYVYIIFLTSRGRKEDLVEGLEAGADDYIVKPFDYNELRTRVRAGGRIVRLQEDLINALKASEYAASHDSLTQLWNRSAILEILRREMARSSREMTPLSIIMIDVDHFKLINDRYGHLGGDAILRQVALRLLSSVRPYDSCGRYGGEEFLLVIPGCPRETALAVGERLRASFEHDPFTTDGGSCKVTISLGVATMDAPREAPMDALIREADEALYRAKGLGRNRVES